MADKLEDVWAARDFPVLIEVVRRIDSGDDTVDPGEVAEATGLTDDEVQLAGRALELRGFVTVRGAWGRAVLFFTGVTSAAYLATGLHPDGDDALTRLVSALQQAAERQGDVEERGRLRRAADALLSVSRDIGVEVMAAVIAKTTGL